MAKFIHPMELLRLRRLQNFPVQVLLKADDDVPDAGIEFNVPDGSEVNDGE